MEDRLSGLSLRARAEFFSPICMFASSRNMRLGHRVAGSRLIPDLLQALRMEAIETLKTCQHGHRFRKRSDCPACPVCEAGRMLMSHFHARLSAPARRALENAGIDSLAKLAAMREKDILALHGIGKSSIPILREALSTLGLSFLPIP
jgi:hypothetical protein